LILLTVGSQLPFDRLVRAVDEWCVASGRTDVVGQIGNPGSGGYRPCHFKWSEFLSPVELDGLLQGADLIISHAGMGSIISALKCGKRIVIMPRLASLGEHRNDHQVATAKRFAGRQGVHVARDENELAATIREALNANSPGARISSYADERLITVLRRYIFDGVIEG
jgi:UDP-N-acetylglucosamine transferase subunit ALG13